jgi:hypothetical protein
VSTASPLSKTLPNPEYIRWLPDLTLVGVVHDHPASIERVRVVLRKTNPVTLALELPPLAVPLYRSYAASKDFSAGGEMSAAISETDVSVVGIDGPSRTFARTFYDYVRRERLDRETLGRLYSAVRATSTRAVRCRLAAAGLGSRTEDERSFSYDCNHRDGIEACATDERSHVSAARTVSAFSPPHVAHRDAIREDCMATVLGELPGPTVAIVGIDHLDGLVSRLQ